MESLGLASTAPKSDGRLKALFWPTIRHDGDVEYITEQGFWICLIVGLFSFVLGAIQGHPYSTLFTLAFYFLAGVGVRQRSKAASIVAFIAYLASGVAAQRLTANGFGVVTVIFLALLLANIRGIWLSARWDKAPAEDKQNDLPPFERLNDTFLDKLSGRWPVALWSRTKWLFTLLTVLQLGAVGFLLLAPRELLLRQIR